MPNSADNATRLDRMMDDDSDVIELTEEVGSHAQDGEEAITAVTSPDELGFDMPQFRVPEDESSMIGGDVTGGGIAKGMGEVPAAGIVRRRGARKTEPTPSVGQDSTGGEYDRQAMVKTIQMQAVDRSQIDAFLSRNRADRAELLLEQRFSPDVILLPPRVLIKKWKEGAPEECKQAARQAEEKATPPLPDVADEPIELDSDVIELEEGYESQPPPRPKNNPPAQPQKAAPQASFGGEDPELGSLVQELLEENKAKAKGPKKLRPRDIWFQEVFTEEYLRTLPRDLSNQTDKDCDFIAKSLGLKKKARILDLACGFGRHSIELTQRGYEMVGLDLSIQLLQKALNDAKSQGLSLKFIHGDMRELSFTGVFDGCFIWQTSLGYFDDRTNLKVLQGVHRALKPGGRFIIDVVNRDYVIGQMPTRTWWEGNNCIFLEESEFDYGSSVLHAKRSFIYEDGSPPLEQNCFIRLYTIHELRQMLHVAGFAVVEVSGERHHRGCHLGASSSRNIILAEKKTKA